MDEVVVPKPYEGIVKGAGVVVAPEAPVTVTVAVAGVLEKLKQLLATVPFVLAGRIGPVIPVNLSNGFTGPTGDQVMVGGPVGLVALGTRMKPG